jgi:Spy/CpxP family protein refolding chaperone
MKKQLLSFIIAGLCAASVALAEPQQQSGPHEKGPGHRMEMLSKRLNLTADQQAKLAPIFTERRAQVRAILQDSSLSREDRMAKMQTIRKDSNAKIEALLTDEQKQNYEQLQQQMRQRAHQRREGGASNQTSNQ